MKQKVHFKAYIPKSFKQWLYLKLTFRLYIHYRISYCDYQKRTSSQSGYQAYYVAFYLFYFITVNLTEPLLPLTISE